MYIYIIFFIVSFLCIYMGKKYENIKWLSICLEILSIVVLSILAGIRDTTIGTDVNVYVKPVFDFYTKHGILAFTEHLYINAEIGYKIFNYLVAIITNNFSILLFLIQFFILMFSFLGIKKLYPKNYILAYSIFILTFYNRTLNIVRQSMALALCIYALHYLFKEDYKRFFITVAIASLFHKSSLIFIVIFIIYILIIKKKVNPYMIATGIFGFGIIMFIFFPQFINMFINLHLLPAKYEYYLNHYVLTKIDFNCLEIGIDLLLICIYLVFRKIYNYKDKKSKFYFILLVISLVCLIIAGRYTSAHRISMYFNIPAMIYFLSNFNFIWNKKKNKRIDPNLIAIGIAIIFWYWIYVYGNSGHTIPFISIFNK